MFFWYESWVYLKRIILALLIVWTHSTQVQGQNNPNILWTSEEQQDYQFQIHAKEFWEKQKSSPPADIRVKIEVSVMASQYPDIENDPRRNKRPATLRFVFYRTLSKENEWTIKNTEQLKQNKAYRLSLTPSVDEQKLKLNLEITVNQDTIPVSPDDAYTIRNLVFKTSTGSINQYQEIH